MSEPPRPEPSPHAPSAPAPANRQGRPVGRFAIAAVAVLAIAAFLVWQGTLRPGEPPAPVRETAEPGRPDAAVNRPVPVVGAKVRKGDLDVRLFAIGTVTPLSTVVVRSRVDGELVSVAFQEGQLVKEGQLLAQIDPRPFEVQLALAQGQRARNEALLENARTDLRRFETLLAQDSISGQQVDTQASLVRQYEAALRADQGAIDSAKLQLEHSRIVAPIGGRVGLRIVDAGNIVRASDPNGIVVITQLQPISVVFPIPGDELPGVLKRLRAGDRIAVDVYDRAQRERLASGRVIAADNQIDLATGTVKLKAEVPNADGLLTPNQFVNVSIVVATRRDATLVPTAAILRGPSGPFVFVVGAGDVVKPVPVDAGPADGDVTAIAGDVAPGATVVVDGADLLRAGSRVELVSRDRAVPSQRPGGAENGRPQPGAAAKGSRSGG